MPNSRHLPASLRYFKARFRTVTRPAFWGTAIFLSVIGLVIREYWSHPNFLRYLQNTQAADTQNQSNPEISKEDRAIAADIDNSPLLLQDVDKSIPPALTLKPSEKPAAPNKSLFEDVVGKKPTGSDNTTSLNTPVTPPLSSLKIDNPFLQDAQNSLRMGGWSDSRRYSGTTPLTNSPAQATSNLGISSANSANQNQNPAPVSALQSAFNQPTINNQSASPSQRPASPNTFNQQLPTNTLPSQSPSLPPTTGMNTGSLYSQPTVVNTPPIYTQPTAGYAPQNPYSNMGGGQVGNNAIASPTVPQPISPTTPGNIAPNTLPTTNQGFNSTTPLAPSTSLGNSSLQPQPLPQSGLASPPLGGTSGQ